VIGAEDIERAERTLQIVYRDKNMIRQLENLQVSREAFDNFLRELVEIQRGYYRDAMARMDPNLEASYNTMLMHFFLVGVIAGRNSERVIE
jgi:hypothetical protein